MCAVLQHESIGVNDPDMNPRKPVLPTPCRLALFFVQKDLPTDGVVHKADWVTADKQTLEKILTPLRDERIVSEVFLLEDATIQGHDVHKVRQAGQRYGADVVLIVAGVGAVDRF